ncbi:MAG: CCA tRNA nucleotidyltransferase [Deltaproteobacteria bacterium]|nr:MAG: CCA tRNA nucleotidyltransferase [Deltaproteobacteria bacterium]
MNLSGDPRQALVLLGQRFGDLFDLFAREGRRLYLVGGSVRDALLGDTHRADYDFATDALPEESLRILRAAGLRTFPIGARFGTIAAAISDTLVEITTFRVQEAYEPGSRKPEVEFGDSLDDDLSRRDLSINAMAIDRHGHLIDPFDGCSALERRILEVPRGGLENTRSILRDDPLRLLRIARFAGRLGFAPTPDTTQAAMDCRAELLRISRERWKMEMDKLLLTRHADQGLAWLAHTGALQVVLPATGPLVRLGQVRRVGAQLLDTPDDLMTRWSVLLLHTVVTEHTDCRLDLSRSLETWPDEPLRTAFASGVASRFRFSNAERQCVERLLGGIPDPASLRADWDRPALRRHLIGFGEDAIRVLDLLDAVGDTVPGLTEHTGRLREALVSLRSVEDPLPRLPKGLGHALHEQLGMPRGPALAEAMARLREAILDEALANDPDIDACIGWLRDN